MALSAQVAGGAVVHVLAQLPQWFTSPVTLVSHPFAAAPSQSPHPGSQLIAHALATQEGAPCAELHTVVQLPQCVTSLETFCSHPLSGLASQSAHPASQEMPHVELVHVAVPWVELHTFGHEPQ